MTDAPCVCRHMTLLVALVACLPEAGAGLLNRSSDLSHPHRTLSTILQTPQLDTFASS